MKIKNQKLKIKIFVFIFSLFTVHCLLFTAQAFAVGGGGEHAFSWKELVWPIINFAILVFILVKFGGKPIRKFFKKRTELIEKSLKEAEEAKKLAQKALLDVEERLKLQDKEMEEIISTARKSGEKEKEVLIEEAEKMAAKLLEQTKANIEYELKIAKEAIRAEAVELAMEIAEKKLREKITKELQESLLEESIAKIEAGK